MIRLATNADLEAILLIIEDAKIRFRLQNSSQWQDEGGYPNRSTFLKDIENQILYVYDHNGEVIGVAAFSEEIEEAYQTIYDGSWLLANDAPTLTIHRLAVKKEWYRKGIAKKILAYAEMVCRSRGFVSIRIDTHEKNGEMQHLLQRCGYSCCGIIYLLRSGVKEGKRLAYEKVIDPITKDIQAVIFDMDGTMIDSMPYWLATGEQIFRQYFFEADIDVHRELDKMSAWELAFRLFDERNDHKGKKDFMNQWLTLMEQSYLHRAHLQEGLISVLEFFKCQNIPMCVATGTSIQLAKPLLDQLGIGDYFTFIATEEMVGKSKHYPDLFLDVVSKLKVPLYSCLLFEDSYHSARTAYGLGMKVVGVQDHATGTDATRLKNYCLDFVDSYPKFLVKIKKEG